MNKVSLTSSRLSLKSHFVNDFLGNVISRRSKIAKIRTEQIKTEVLKAREKFVILTPHLFVIHT